MICDRRGTASLDESGDYSTDFVIIDRESSGWVWIVRTDRLRIASYRRDGYGGSSGDLIIYVRKEVKT